MKGYSTLTILKVIILLLFIVLGGTAFSTPTFQVYSPDAVASDYGEDEDTWLVTESSFDLWVIGAYSPQTVSLTDVTLCVLDEENPIVIEYLRYFTFWRISFLAQVLEMKIEGQIKETILEL